MSDTLSRVKSVLAESMDVGTSTIADDCCQKTSHQWDSVVSMMFILGIEEEFSVSLELEDAENFVSLPKVVQMLSTTDDENATFA